MAILDDIGKKITDVGQMTKDIADVAKYNSMIMEEEKAIRELYEKIGEKYTAECSDSATGQFKEWTDAVAGSKQRIAEYREVIRNLKGITVCPACGTELDAGAAFCSVCGEKILREEPSVERVPCVKCGAMVIRGSRFCTSCGAVLHTE